MKSIENIIQPFKVAMEEMYGDELAKILLYGSYARGDFYEESDIDLMVVLDVKQLKIFQEIRKISAITTPLSLTHQKIIAVVPTTLNKFQTYDSMFYRFVHKEGIELL
jgi:predicted nucleotidyltransferase